MAAFGPLIDVTTLGRLLDAPDLVVLDCRFDLEDPGAGRRAWLEAHIPGARYADLDADLAAMPSAYSGRHPLPERGEAARRFGALGVGGDSRVVVYDEGGGAIAARAWWMLGWLGHERVALLDGGFRAWTESGQPVESGPVETLPATLTARRGQVDIVTTDDLITEMNRQESPRLVDARDRRRFRGEVEPIDPVAGHIPGAVNVPFSRLLGDDGRFRPAGEIAAVERAVERHVRIRRDGLSSGNRRRARRAASAARLHRFLERVDPGPGAPGGDGRVTDRPAGIAEPA